MADHDQDQKGLGDTRAATCAAIRTLWVDPTRLDLVGLDASFPEECVL